MQTVAYALTGVAMLADSISMSIKPRCAFGSGTGVEGVVVVS